MRFRLSDALVATIPLFFGLAALIVVFTDGQINATSRGIILGFGATMAGVSGATLVRYITRIRIVPMRLALTGAPNAGKTVFSVLLYEFLMNNRSDIEFTTESRTAIAIHQAVRRLDDNVWPDATRTGEVIHYEGAIRFSRRLTVKLDIGDSAGEHWLDLSRDQGSEDTKNYLTWILSAQAIAHVISPTELTALEQLMKRDVDDLRLASRLNRSTRGKSSTAASLLVVLAKADIYATDEPFKGLISPQEVTDELMVIRTVEQLDHSPLLSRISIVLEYDLAAAFRRFAAELDTAFSSIRFMFTSIETAVSTSRLELAGRDDLPHWIAESAWGFRFEEPAPLPNSLGLRR